jgi:CheY-like chemotaxis protein
LRVLVVEDHRESAEALALSFREQGHEVAVAPDGPSALEAVRAAQPDVVFLDFLLPGIDGCEVAKGIRRLSAWRRPFLVALTGLGDEPSQRRSQEAGIDLHLVKPVDPATLHGLLRRLQAFLRDIERFDPGI